MGRYGGEDDRVDRGYRPTYEGPRAYGEESETTLSDDRCKGNIIAVIVFFSIPTWLQFNVDGDHSRHHISWANHSFISPFDKIID